MKRLLTLAVILSSLVLNLPLQAAAPQPKRGGTLTLAVSKELALMNPLVNTSSTEARIRELMFEPLLGRDDKGVIRPRLAETWEISKDAKLYTFHLRKGVKFHNGGEMTADDIKFAIDYTLNPKNGAYGLADLDAVEKVEATDKYTVKISLKKINPLFLTTLTDIRAFSVIDRK